MTRPQKRNILRERITSLVLALLLLTALWLLARASQMTGARQHQAHVLRALALERIVVPEGVASLEKPRAAEHSSPTEATLNRGNAEALDQSAARRALLKNELPEVTALEHRPTSSDLDIRMSGGIEPVKPNRLESLHLREDLDLGRPTGMSGLSERTGHMGGQESGHISLAGRISDSSPFEERERRLVFAGDDFARSPQREIPPEGPVVEREERVLDPRGDTLDPDELIRWMRLRPGELPPGIKRHVDWQEAALTSTATIVHEGEAYELYLMARLPIREIHVVLVKGRQTYYLIDRSFQHEGRKFRAGTARRSEAVITGVVSEERAAASPEASHFYSVFLSWWQRERLQL